MFQCEKDKGKQSNEITWDGCRCSVSVDGIDEKWHAIYKSDGT
jgi:hypothetical protein